MCKWFVFLLCGAGCGSGNASLASAKVGPQQPVSGIEVPAGTSLQAAIDAAPSGATLLLQPGDYRGGIKIGRPLRIWGPPTALVRGVEGSTLRVTGDHVTLQGFTVIGSGQRFDLMDGGVHLQGEDLVVEGLTVRESLFGILAERCKRVSLRGNTVIGTGLPAMGLRGDGIRLWETEDSEVLDNTVRDSRDVVVWYSSRNHLARNTVLRSRYGTHFMYSHDNVLEDSTYVEDEVGVFAMYSHDLVIRRNLIAKSGGSAGIGVGIKESGNLTVESNWFLANTTGLYIDTAPLDPAHHNRYLHNVVRFSESAVVLHATIQRSEFLDNQFLDNGAVVKVGGQGNALGCVFAGNYYDTYQGYDFDGDGRGDVPFEFRRLSTQLEGRYPELSLLHGAPAMAMVDLVGEVMPLFAPKQLMQDLVPRLRPLAMTWMPEVGHAR
ncbi:MAG: nitrous oxide reductase family maturation protein NosD [Planctomycetes bacterium]|nr:nitrous oxide reductase family maturation protein NosD [Planctomycetota bacterium]MCC7061369.1 nitrous oxide reductase family maturation protein NosD [Planctomycetota bacterium]